MTKQEEQFFLDSLGKSFEEFKKEFKHLIPFRGEDEEEQ